jgi:hypothetical protein
MSASSASATLENAVLSLVIFLTSAENHLSGVR